MAELESDGIVSHTLDAGDYTPKGDLNSLDAELSLVVGATERAETFISQKQWGLLWRDADLLFQSPRPMSVYEGTYILEPNVQRFTVAKVCNSVIPSLYKGLFYEDPPMVLRPRPGTSQHVVDAKKVVFSVLMEGCKFKTETKWGLEQMALLGTGIWKWGIDYKKIQKITRKKTVLNLSTGPNGSATDDVAIDSPPDITVREKIVPRPFFEFRPLDKVLVDPKCAVGDIREADYVVDLRYMDFYQLNTLREGIEQLDDDDDEKAEWFLPKTEEELKSWFMPPVEVATVSVTDQAAHVYSVVHHAEQASIQVTPDLLRTKKEVLEYWENDRKIIVVDRKKVICSGVNRFGEKPFLSANWWNRQKAFYGMGLGLIVGQNQRVDQGTINSILKILSYGVNPIYLRKRDSNAPTQMIRTGLGKILTVDTEVDKAYKLLDVPKIPSEIWSALQESQSATESSSGADASLVQGSSAGPRAGIGRSATGAGMLGQASATRLDGPLDNFIEQVFKPWLDILNMLVFRYLSDKDILDIVGEELGKDFELDLQDFHDANISFEVLAGASLAAKRTMSQSMTLITQIFQTPQIQQQLAEINGEYIDYKPILEMWMEASEWKNKQDIIKPLTDEMKQRMAQQSQAAQMQSKAAIQQQSNQQKFEQKQALDDQATNNRIKRDMIRDVYRANEQGEAINGEPSTSGLDGEEPQGF